MYVYAIFDFANSICDTVFAISSARISAVAYCMAPKPPLLLFLIKKGRFLLFIRVFRGAPARSVNYKQPELMDRFRLSCEFIFRYLQ